MATTDMNAQMHIKDENGNVNNIFPATKIANVEGLTAALNAKADTTTVNNQLSGKVDKETGKGLSTNDYTTAEKNKLAGIAAGATAVTVDSTLSGSSTNAIQNKVVTAALEAKANASDVTSSLANKADATTVSSLSSQVGANTSNIATQTSRIDAITSLPSGSTSGDAELMDIRVKADGTSASSAGTAVRSQFDEVKSTMDFFKKSSSPLNTGTWEKGSIDSSGAETSSNTRIRTKFINTQFCENIIVNVDAGYKAAVEKYDHEYRFLGEDSFSASSHRNITLGTTVAYIRLIGATTSNSTSISPSDATKFNVIGVSRYLNKCENDALFFNDAASLVSESDMGMCLLNPNDFVIGSYRLNDQTIETQNNEKAIRSTTVIHAKKYDEIRLSDYTHATLKLIYVYNGTKYERTIDGTDRDFYSLTYDVDYYVSIIYDNFIDGNNVALLLDLFQIYRASKDTMIDTKIKKFDKNKKIVNPGECVKGDGSQCVSNFIRIDGETIVSIIPTDAYGFYCFHYSENMTMDDTTVLGRYTTNPICKKYTDGFLRIMPYVANESPVSDADIQYFMQSIKIVTGAVNNYKNDGIKSIAHAMQGYGGSAPMNTLSGLRKCAVDGFKYVECDVNFTSDNVCVCLHDDTINATARNADGSVIVNDVYIRQITYEQALTYDFGIKWGTDQRYAGEKIPRLIDVLNAARALDLYIYIDFKTTMSDELCLSVVDIVNSVGMRDRVIYSLANVEKCVLVSRYDPYATVILISSNADDYSKCAALLSGHNSVIFGLNHSAITATAISNCKSVNLPVETWTVNEDTDISSLDPYVSGVISDYYKAGEMLYNQNIGTIELDFKVPGIVLSRVQIVQGGYAENGRNIDVSIIFESLTTSNNYPYLFSGMPEPVNGKCVLSALRLDGDIDDPSAIELVDCGIVGDKLMLKSVTNGAKYIVTGRYII